MRQIKGSFRVDYGSFSVRLYHLISCLFIYIGRVGSVGIVSGVSFGFFRVGLGFIWDWFGGCLGLVETLLYLIVFNFRIFQGFICMTTPCRAISPHPPSIARVLFSRSWMRFWPWLCRPNLHVICEILLQQALSFCWMRRLWFLTYVPNWCGRVGRQIKNGRATSQCPHSFVYHKQVCSKMF